jgi:hypothetical protein
VNTTIINIEDGTLIFNVIQHIFTLKKVNENDFLLQLRTKNEKIKSITKSLILHAFEISTNSKLNQLIFSPASYFRILIVM